MLTRVIELSIRHRAVVLVVLGFFVLLGARSLARLPFDAFPDTTPIQVTVNAVAPAYSPLEIERRITFALEQAIGSLPGLASVRSVSKFGFSQITAQFADGTDIYLARQLVTERLRGVELPPGVDAPTLGPIATGLGEVFQYLIRSEIRSPMELRTLHDWVVRPQLLAVPGVAEINTWGGYERQFHVVVDPATLVKYGLTLNDLERALTANNTAAGGGALEIAGESLIVQGDAFVTGIADLERIVVAAHGGVPVLIRDVARVEEGYEIRRGAVTHGGEGETVLGLGFMLMGENSRDVTRALSRALDEARRSLPRDVTLEPVYRRTDLVDHVLATVRTNLLEGALLVIAVLFVFLGNFRAGLIVASAIPLSMLFAFDMMLRAGIAGSLMSLGAIDFGLIVDSSVVMIENASRRLAEDRSGRPAEGIIRDAAVEVRKPTLFGELIIASVFFPILALEGVEGKLFRPMALTVIFALAGSMILSMTVMPALAAFVLKRRAETGDNIVVRGLKRAYAPLLDGALARPRMVVAVAGILVFAAAGFSTRLGAEFVPRLREMAIVVNTVRLAGVSLDESVRYGTQIERRLLESFPDEIEHIWTRTGTAEVATDPMGLEVSDVFLTLTPRDSWTRARTQDELVAAMSAAIDDMPGMRAIFTQPIEMRVNEMLAGIRADVGIKLFGDDFDLLREHAGIIRDVMRGIPGAADVSVEQITGAPILDIAIDREAAARHGVAAETIMDIVESLGTRRVGEVREGQMRFDIALRLSENVRTDAAAIGRIPVITAQGARIPLANVARIAVREVPSTIQRERSNRRIVVQANVRGRDLGSFVNELRAALTRQLDLPAGYFYRLEGQFEHLQSARRRLMIVIPVALILVATLLYFSYGRARDVLRIFTSVPFAAVGGVAALIIRDMPFTISAGVGFVALSGISVFGDMVLVSHIRQLISGGMPLAGAVREAALTRVRPVLMTALVAALGFVPMALNTGVGAEVQQPLATVVIGGIVTSTVATLLVLPVLYALTGGGEATGGDSA
ncbi:CusA/CzcA family heavy metal efflux RND transporter [bacterium]|nr:CusA/CzcA family heavy metal efflux RND transporter [bacterium]